MKPVVNHDGKVTQCVFHCESEHSNEYSFRHGHHCKGNLPIIFLFKAPFTFFRLILNLN